MKRFYSDEMVYKIFAIYDDIVEKRVYIGKTVSRLSAVRSRHRCGHCKYTQELYEIDFLEPEFVLLEEVHCTGAVAYRHILSWLRIFGENEFEILNPDGMLEQSEQMQEETLKIYRKLSEKSLEEYLEGEVIESVPSTQKKQKAKEKERASCQLCLRITAGEKAEFQKYCKMMNLRQTDALARLLSTSGENPAPNIRRLSELLDASETRCTKLAEENNKLREGQLLPRSERIDNNAKKTFLFAQKAIQEFVKITYTKETYTDHPIKEFRYDEFKRHFPQAEQYRYPLEEGCYVVKLQAMVWGKARNPVYFVMGKTMEGVCLKFRFYQKREFIGEQVRRSFYGLRNSQWMLAGRAAPDGAVDLMAAFPLLYPLDGKEKKGTLSLNEKILEATLRK